MPPALGFVAGILEAVLREILSTAAIKSKADPSSRSRITSTHIHIAVGTNKELSSVFPEDIVTELMVLVEEFLEQFSDEEDEAYLHYTSLTGDDNDSWMDEPEFEAYDEDDSDGELDDELSLEDLRKKIDELFDFVTWLR